MHALGSGLLLARILAADPAPEVAAVDEPAVEFVWDAPTGCPTEAEVNAVLEATLGEPLAARTGPTTVVVARVRPASDGKGLRLRVVLAREDGLWQRSEQRTGCRELADLAVFLTVMALGQRADEVTTDAPAVAAAADPEGEVATNVAAALEEDLASSSTSVESPVESSPAAPAKSTARRPRAALQLAGGASAGGLPGIGTGLGGATALLWTRARVEFRGAFEPARLVEVGETGAAELRLATLGLRAGPVFRTRRVEFPVTAGIELGGLLGRGLEPVDAERARLFFVAVQVAPAVLVVPHPRIGLGVVVEGAVHLTRPRVLYTRNGETRELYRPAPASVRILLAIEVRSW